MKQPEILRTTPVNKPGAQALAATIINTILEGKEHPAVAAIKLKAMEEAIKQVRANKEVREFTIEEIQKEDSKRFEFHGAKVEVAETGTKYDYSACDDETLNGWLMDASDLADKIKTRQTMLKTLPEGGMADPETGALLKRPSKKSTTSIKVTLG